MRTVLGKSDARLLEERSVMLPYSWHSPSMHTVHWAGPEESASGLNSPWELFLGAGKAFQVRSQVHDIICLSAWVGD